MDEQIKINWMNVQVQEVNFPKPTYTSYLRIVLLLRCVNLCPCHETIFPLALAHPEKDARAPMTVLSQFDFLIRRLTIWPLGVLLESLHTRLQSSTL